LPLQTPQPVLDYHQVIGGGFCHTAGSGSGTGNPWTARELIEGDEMKAALKFELTAVVAATMIGLPAVAFGAREDAKRDFETACISCHGSTGKGDGPLSNKLRTRPTDLTALARNNNGIFPAERVSRVIDGREGVKAHGKRDMPVWGNSFQMRDVGPSPASRIEALTDYIKSLQVK
jgi:mono/diheme cytochrome c family protein